MSATHPGSPPIATTLIFLGGEPPSPPLARSVARAASRIIAADSGYHAAVASGVQPDVLTGDFDSIDALPAAASLTVVPAHEQDATDFEKALRQVPPGCTTIEILGGTGLRSDHFLTNLLIAAGLPAAWSVTFLDDQQTLHRVTPACPVHLAVAPGTVISLIPFAACSGVSTTGLHWDLHAAGMGPPARLGQSNRASRSNVSVSLESGTLFLVVNHPDGLLRAARPAAPQA